MANPNLVTSGRIHGLQRKVGKIGGEHITFAVTTHDLESWNRLIAITEQDAVITLEPAQGELVDGSRPARVDDEDGEPAEA